MKINTLAADLGNAETKLYVDGILYMKQPTVIKNLLTVDPETNNNIDEIIEELPRNTIVEIKSSAIKRDGIYAIGEKTYYVDGAAQNLDIELGKKYKSDIPVIMLLGMLAVGELQKQYKVKNKIPKTLSVTKQLATALPVNEYSVKSANELTERLLNATHTATIYVGDEQTIVNITFTDIKVVPEGTPAIMSIAFGGPEMFEAYNLKYDSNDDNKYFRNKKILHCDIGDGTTEYIYSVGINPVLKKSFGQKRGVGHATEMARKLFNERMEIELAPTRQMFMEIVKDKSHKYNADAVQCMNMATGTQADLIANDILNAFVNKVGGDADILAVYGGGSIQLHNALYETLEEFCDDKDMKLLWIDEQNAQSMNVNGLNIMAEKILFNE